MTNITIAGQQIISQCIQHDDIVIIAPLNWGLGHASRCIPLIQYISTICKEVIIASDGASLDLLRKEFPHYRFYTLPSYNITYKYDNMALNLLVQSPSLVSGFFKEHNAIKKIVRDTNATVIISDNRFGCKVAGIKSIYITHQINILHSTKVLGYFASKIHQWLIKKYDYCWVPDNADKSTLAGKLSSPTDLNNVQYIGPLSRISYQNIPVEWDICVLLSGPEPQRTKVEISLITELNKLNQYNILFIRGSESVNELPVILDHIHITNLLTAPKISEALNSSSVLISRSGFSTLMDISTLNIKAIFIPTPGQTEQEYLASLWSKKPGYHAVNQKEISKIPQILVELLGR